MSPRCSPATAGECCGPCNADSGPPNTRPSSRSWRAEQRSRDVSLLDSFWKRAGIVLLDGGLATELERRGADLRDSLWSAKLLVENPALIRQIHYDYYAAGANVA